MCNLLKKLNEQQCTDQNYSCISEAVQAMLSTVSSLRITEQLQYYKKRQGCDIYILFNSLYRGGNLFVD